MRARLGEAAGQAMRASSAVIDLTSCNRCVVSCHPLSTTNIQFSTHACRTTVLGKEKDELHLLDNS